MHLARCRGLRSEGGGQEHAESAAPSLRTQPSLSSRPAAAVLVSRSPLAARGGGRPRLGVEGAIGALSSRAICPDFFVGKEPWNPSDDWSTFDEWLKTRDARKTDKEADVVLKYLKQQYSAKKIGVVGFCWGGIVVHHLMMKCPELKAGVSVYGIIRDSDDRYNLLKPTFFIFGEKDDVIPLDQVTLLEQKLKQHCKVDYRVKIYPGQTHGFVHRRREDINPQDKPYIEEARKDMISWLNKYI
nr:carboxymethylenebutenolidase homolog isoform X2 [Chrysemys picta bellii]